MFRFRTLSMAAACVACLFLAPSVAHANEDASEGAQTAKLSTRGAQESLPRGTLHISSHDVKVVINNGFATTTIDQVLRNDSTRDVEAAWAFPLPKEAALSELSIQAGEKSYVGEVVKKQRAREIYEAEKTAGHTAATAEQHEYFHYQVKITRVPAGQDVVARVVYYQPLIIEGGVGRYRYPMTEGNTDDLNRAFWSMNRAVAQQMSIDVTVKTAFPVDKLMSPSHASMTFRSAGEDMWQGQFQSATAGLDRDFTLWYRLHPEVPARIEMLTHREAGAPEGTFMAVVTPGSDLAPIEGGTDWAFVLDISGSMEGEKLRLLKRGVTQAISGLNPADRVQLIVFNKSARRLTTGWTPVKARAKLSQLVDGMTSRGGTNVFAGLHAAYEILDADRPTGIILVSDGVANAGPHNYRDLVGLSAKHDVRIFTFAIGNSANERMLDDIAKFTNGTSASISVHDEIGAHLLLARERMTHTALHGVTFNLPGASVIYPKTMPTLYMGQQLVVVGRYDKSGPSTLRVSARVSGKEVAWSVPVELPATDSSNPELERIYALRAIGDLERQAWLRGDPGEARSAIEDLAMRYSLVTEYTSMIVLEDVRKAQYGIGSHNADRRKAENAAAASRATGTNHVRTHTSGTPLAGNRAAHAPTRNARRVQNQGSSGGGGGSGALGPWHLLLAAGLAYGARRRRRATR